MDWPLAVMVAAFLTGTLVVLGIWQRNVARAQDDQAKHRLQQNQSGGHPIAQHPQINPYLCLGCSSCVYACPEHGALAVVCGRAQLVHPSRCVGHGYCESACPVGALTVGLGDTSKRADLPVLTEELETSVPNVFIAGELGGIALIRCAIEQGCEVVETIAGRLRNDGVAPGGADPLDVLIVGSGPAGIAAALRAKQYELSLAVVDQNDLGGTVRKYPRNKLTMTEPVDLPLFGRMKRTEYTKEELIELWEKIFRDAGLEVRAGVKFTGLDQEADDVLSIETSGGTVRCRYLILALGRRGTPRRLGVPGEESERVLYALTDAVSHSHENLLVVGGGDSAIEAALALSAQPGNNVTLSYRREGFFRLKEKNLQRLKAQQAEGRVRVILNSQVTRIDDQCAHVQVRRGDQSEDIEVPVDYVYVLAGGEPPYPFLKRIGVRFGSASTADVEVKL